MSLIFSAFVVFFLRTSQNFDLDPVGSFNFVADMLCKNQAGLLRSKPCANTPVVGYVALVNSNGGVQIQVRESRVDLDGPVVGVCGQFHLQCQLAGRCGYRHITSPELDGSSFSRHFCNVKRSDLLKISGCSRNRGERCHSENV